MNFGSSGFNPDPPGWIPIPIEKMYGYRDEMEDMVKTFDRGDHPGLITGDRAHYRTILATKCDRCGKETNLVIDWLGGLYFHCKECNHSF